MKKINCKGLIQINRTYGGRNVLFGSNIPHDTCMRLTISQAYISRSFNENHYYPTNKIIEIELSPSQYAEMITNLNHGVGVPCTITKFMEERVPNDLKLNDELNLVKSEYSESVDKIMEEIRNTIYEIPDEKAMSPKKIRDLKRDLVNMLYRLTKEAPFMKERFDETIDKIFVEAKASIDDVVNLTLANIGLDTIKMQKLLENKNEIDENDRQSNSITEK